jgi:capsular polysaccharide biosynthesis protein
MTSEQMIIEVRKRKWRFLIFTVSVFILTLMFQSRIIESYSSTTSFIVNETEVAYLNGPGQVITSPIDNNNSSVNRLFQFVYSDEMAMHLIKKFNLYTYYQISPDEQFAYAKVVSRLSNHVKLSRSDLSIIKVSVSDKDRYQAAAIANDVVATLNTINERYLKNQLKTRINIYEALYLDLKNDLDAHEQKMSRILENYKFVIHSLEKSKNEVESLKYSLIDLTSNLKVKRDEMIRMRGLYSVMLQTLNKEHFNTITSINTALPNYRSSTVANVIISFVVALFAMCGMILLLNIYLTHTHHIKLFFRKD